MFTLCFFSRACQLDHNGILEIHTLHQHSKYAILCKAVFPFFPDFIVFVGIDRLNPDKLIPMAILKGAKGLAILTIAKAGVLLAYKLGTGLVISQRLDGSWSASSAIFSIGLGWGAQVQQNFHVTSSVNFFLLLLLP